MSGGGTSGGAELAQLAALGEYFALPVLANVDPDTEWQCLPALFTDATLTDHVRRTHAAMTAAAECSPQRIPVRVAASSFQLGVAARLLSPVIGAALCLGAVPLLDLYSVRWCPSHGHTPRFAVTGPEWAGTNSAGTISATVVSALLALGDHLDRLFALSTQVSRGNIASAANGAVTVLGMTRPDLLVSGRALIQELVHTGALAGTGSFIGDRFTRRSCCLYYQVPRSGLCGDCVLAASQPGGAD
ncbi:(2Fe-2S)-binding protein [Mycolicibacterium sp. J2]|uniref:(2Fe-2S)-binding protein n=1 Tax=Mycolicibacterium sp. J2 TaxID=2993511 RepID=UPI00224AC2DD|nr:(2Fe-2S)-binding protein [Mycolicibacterium sp. J2]MCX2712025.1 (2Fe-2S)-binding protein [Mycolicibacterium sp. J2]